MKYLPFAVVKTELTRPFYVTPDPGAWFRRWLVCGAWQRAYAVAGRFWTRNGAEAVAARLNCFASLYADQVVDVLKTRLLPHD